MVQESQQDSDVTADEIILAAASMGLYISQRQLRRWHTEGLIPRPNHVHESKKSGSRSLYPGYAKEQACHLRQITFRFRDVKKCGWYLWRLGWPVHQKYWQPVFDEVLDELSRLLQDNLVKVVSDEGVATFELSDEFEEKLETATYEPLSHPVGGPLKQMLGSERTATIVNNAFQIMVGNFQPDLKSSDVDTTDNQVSFDRIMEIGFSSNADDKKLILANFKWLNEVSKRQTILEVCRRISQAELQHVSKELCNIEGLILALQGQPELIPRLKGNPVFSLQLTPKFQAQRIMFWAIARQMPGKQKD